MRTDAQSPFIIFSVTNKCNKGTRAELHANTEAVQFLESDNIAFKVVDGCYKGETETSYLVHARHVKFVEVLCRAFDQESYLLVDAYRNAVLVYLKDGKREDIGQFQRADRDTALAQDGYTYDPVLEQHWVVK